MPQRVTVDSMESIRPLARAAVTEYARRLRFLHYCDLRLEISEGKGASAENGQEKSSSEDYGLSLGVRVLAGRTTVAPGYVGRMLGAVDMDRLEQVMREAIQSAHRRALASAERKATGRSSFGALGDSLYSTQLAPIPIRQDTIRPVYRVDPRTVPLEQVAKMAVGASRIVAAVSNQVVYNVVSAATLLTRELFCSSEGTDIDQSCAMTEGFVLVVARGPEGNLELYDFLGHQAGWETALEGVDRGAIRLPSLNTFAADLAQTAVEVANAPRLKPPAEEVVVVTDPHFNTLVAHEVVGHPSELDRALKLETAYAGRSWLLKDLADNQIGKPVASPLVSAFSDPTMEGYGHYLYDHEGTPARRVYHIRNGVYEEFLNSRQTAAVLGVAPNGSFKATDASLVPLIRMSNTVFAPGDRDPQDIIKEVERGYYVSGHRIPSVAESRENFRISAIKVYEIRNGELGKLYRDGGIMADSRDYFMRVDAVGNDFRLYPIPNCGKGQPMQTKRMGNGGPTMRSVARLMGSAG
ncbi:MAG: TldD/PmbA family protein [Dehalococcoidia bacterium]|nr:TldD/PmbA family protein [Dehalococcoidia bacterium]